MGGFFGAVSKRDCVVDVFYGTDFHSHLGTRRGGMAALSPTGGIQRYIHNIESTPFRTKFEKELDEMSGGSCIGCISDTDPQPILIRSRLGNYAICTVGIVRNLYQLADSLLAETGCHFEAMSGGLINATELIAALINRCDSFEAGICHAQSVIEGTACILILTDDGRIIAARDKMGRLPVIIGRDSEGFAVSFESFAYEKLGYETYMELGPGQVVSISADAVETLVPAGEKLKICAFLWSYYGYPNATYEGINVEVMRTRNGHIMARDEALRGTLPPVDYICGVPDSGIPHAIGFSNELHLPFARPFVKYTPTWPRSFITATQKTRNHVAKMKLIPVHDLISGKRLLFVDDSIVRGTQLHETVDFLYENGAKEVHMRSACPPIMFGCKHLNFSRNTGDMDLITRRTIFELEGQEGEQHLDEYLDGKTVRGLAMRCSICKKLKLATLEYQSLEGLVEAIGLPEENLCTYCWNGKE